MFKEQTHGIRLTYILVIRGNDSWWGFPMQYILRLKSILTIALGLSLLVGCFVNSNEDHAGGVITDPTELQAETSEYFQGLLKSLSEEESKQNSKLEEINLFKNEIFEGEVVRSDLDSKIDSLLYECDTLQDIIDSLMLLIKSFEVDSLQIDNSVQIDTLVSNSDIVQDAIIRFGRNHSGGAWFNDNSGATTCIAVGTYDNNTINRTLLRWDHTQLQNYGTIQKVELVIHPINWVQKSAQAPDNQFRIHLSPILKSWKEGNVIDNGECYSQLPNSSSIDGVTAMERFYQEPWGTVGVGLDNDDASRLVSSFALSTVQSENPFVFDVTADFNTWLSGESDNFGWVLSNPREFNGIHETYPELVSSDSPNELFKPRIIVYYNSASK